MKYKSNTVSVQTQDDSRSNPPISQHTNLQNALFYAKLGFRVLPIPIRTKSPKLKGWVENATTSIRTLQLWFRGKESTNIGVATGKKSGIVVLDVDVKHNCPGKQSLQALIQRYGPLPETPRVRTGSGGLHYFFAYPNHGQVPTVHASSKTNHPLGAGLDLQSDGAQVLLPPSIHPNGTPYTWELSPEQVPFAPLPDWIHQLVKKPPVSSRTTVQPKTLHLDSNLSREQHYALTALQREAQAVAQAPHGTRNNTLNTSCVSLGGFIPAGLLTEQQIVQSMLQACQDNGYLRDKGESATWATLQSGLKKGKSSPRDVPDRTTSNATPASTLNRSKKKKEEWKRLLSFTEKGKLLNSVHNTQMILTMDPAWNKVLGYDERADQVVWLSSPPWQNDPKFYKRTGKDPSIPRTIEEEDITRCASWMKLYYGVDFRYEHLSRAMAVAAKEHSFDPVRDYLEALHWDGTKRLDQWLVTYLGAEPTDLVLSIGSKWIVSAVARTYHPGCKVDHMLVLEGEQGIGKSTALKTLFSPKWFTDELPEIGSKDAGVQLQGAFCVEFSELEGLSKREVCAVKAFLSRSTDRYRAPYAKSAKDYPRRCVFAGTTNEQMYLRDSTGNRRFWPVTVGQRGPIQLDSLQQDRDQLWAEAVHRFRNGDVWYLTDSKLLKDVQEEQAQRYERDEWESVIEEYCRYKDSVTTSQLLERVLELRKDQWTRAHQMRLASVLRRIGWERRRARGAENREWRFFPKT